jgi:hypothetical protein
MLLINKTIVRGTVEVQTHSVTTSVQEEGQRLTSRLSRVSAVPI